jgi:hypothetical protein
MTYFQIQYSDAYLRLFEVIYHVLTNHLFVTRSGIKDTRSWVSGIESRLVVDAFFWVTSMVWFFPYCNCSLPPLFLST